MQIPRACPPVHCDCALWLRAWMDGEPQAPYARFVDPRPGEEGARAGTARPRGSHVARGEGCILGKQTEHNSGGPRPLCSTDWIIGSANLFWM